MTSCPYRPPHETVDLAECFEADAQIVAALVMLGAWLLANVMHHPGYSRCEPGYSWVMCGYRLMVSAACSAW
jgi:hypothetical protein